MEIAIIIFLILFIIFSYILFFFKYGKEIEKDNSKDMEKNTIIRFHGRRYDAREIRYISAKRELNNPSHFCMRVIDHQDKEINSQLIDAIDTIEIIRSLRVLGKPIFVQEIMSSELIISVGFLLNEEYFSYMVLPNGDELYNKEDAKKYICDY